jgi:hypothetical protein
MDHQGPSQGFPDRLHRDIVWSGPKPAAYENDIELGPKHGPKVFYNDLDIVTDGGYPNDPVAYRCEIS